MRHFFGGPSRAATKAVIRASVVFAAALLSSTWLGSSARARTTLDVAVPPHGANVYVAPAEADPAATPHRFAFLHGMCSDARASCEAVRDLVEPHGALACPTGNGACGGWADWKGEGEEKAAHVDASLDAAWARLGEKAAGDEVLIGFSRGAFVARDIAYARGRYKVLVLIGAATIPDAALLRAHGIRKVVLASGDFDPARRTMEKAARELAASGLPAKYVHLGPFGHALPRDLARSLGGALDWALVE